MPTFQLVEIDFKVFNSRDQIQERQKQHDMRQQAALLPAALSHDQPRLNKMSTGKNQGPWVRSPGQPQAS